MTVLLLAADRVTVNVKLVVPLFPSGRETLLIDSVGVADHIGQIEPVIVHRRRRGAHQRLDRNRVEAAAVPDRRLTQ